MQIHKRLAAVVLSLLLCYCIVITTYAHTVPESSQSGSVSIGMEFDGKAVAGGALTIYQVGEVNEDDGNYSFILTGDFSACGKSLENIESPGLAEAFAEYASDHDLKGVSQNIDENGRAVFSDLELGLYLIVQKEAADGYEAITPFLVSVPMYEDGVYIYDVDASPKVETLTQAKTTVTKTHTDGKKLPQTGQLNWPVPVLAVVGMSLFLTGWALRLGKKTKTYEL